MLQVAVTVTTPKVTAIPATLATSTERGVPKAQAQPFFISPNNNYLFCYSGCYYFK